MGKFVIRKGKREEMLGKGGRKRGDLSTRREWMKGYIKGTRKEKQKQAEGEIPFIRTPDQGRKSWEGR